MNIKEESWNTQTGDWKSSVSICRLTLFRNGIFGIRYMRTDGLPAISILTRDRSAIG